MRGPRPRDNCEIVSGHSIFSGDRGDGGLVKLYAVVRFISSHRGWPAFNNYLFIVRLAAYTSPALFPGSTVMPIVPAFHSINEMKNHLKTVSTTTMVCVDLDATYRKANTSQAMADTSSVRTAVR